MKRIKLKGVDDIPEFYLEIKGEIEYNAPEGYSNKINQDSYN